MGPDWSRSHRPMDGRLDLIQLRPTRANGQPALAVYVQEMPAEPVRAYGIMVFALERDRVVGITGLSRAVSAFRATRPA